MQPGGQLLCVPTHTMMVMSVCGCMRAGVASASSSSSSEALPEALERSIVVARNATPAGRFQRAWWRRVTQHKGSRQKERECSVLLYPSAVLLCCCCCFSEGVDGQWAVNFTCSVALSSRLLAMHSLLSTATPNTSATGWLICPSVLAGQNDRRSAVHDECCSITL